MVTEGASGSPANTGELRARTYPDTAALANPTNHDWGQTYHCIIGHTGAHGGNAKCPRIFA